MGFLVTFSKLLKLLRLRLQKVLPRPAVAARGHRTSREVTLEHNL